MEHLKFYLYRHIRLDKNEPFYIGIGTKSDKTILSFNKEYSRAFNKSTRNKIWKNIINKSNYFVEILLESNDYEFILQKEIEFIKLYGRINLKTGCLSNLTDGGEGGNGQIMSIEARSKISINNKGKFISPKHRTQISDTLKFNYKSGLLLPTYKKVYVYDDTGNFLSCEDNLKMTSIRYNCSIRGIIDVAIGNCLQNKKLRFYYEDKGLKIEKLFIDKTKTSIKVKRIIDNKIFDSIKSAAKEINSTLSGLAKAIKEKRTCKGFYFEYMR